MDYQHLHMEQADLVVSDVRNFSLEEILECGQCFRWHRVQPGVYRGTVNGKTRTITQTGSTLRFHGTTEGEFLAHWETYFDFRRNYSGVKRLLESDPVMARAIAFSPGMRVLRQPPWETLCSFIISANNNIQRIRGILDRLCRLLGEPVEDGFDFPTPDALAALEPEALGDIRCGYRAAYLIDAARKVAAGELDLPSLYTLPLDQARKALMGIKGVGPKVAECVLLYGFSRAECVPVDVWIKRALQALYPQGLPPQIQPVAGLGQQYLFHYVRHCPEALPSAG